MLGSVPISFVFAGVFSGSDDLTSGPFDAKIAKGLDIRLECCDKRPNGDGHDGQWEKRNSDRSDSMSVLSLQVQGVGSTLDERSFAIIVWAPCALCRYRYRVSGLSWMVGLSLPVLGLDEPFVDTDTWYREYVGWPGFAINVLQILVNGRCMQHASKALTLRPREASIESPHIKYFRSA
jgi:hypothetical protein